MAKPDNHIRLLLVTNALPVQPSDFLGYKVAGLSQLFDLHILCWDIPGNKDAFLKKYPQIPAGNVHVYSRLGSTISTASLIGQYTSLFIKQPVSMFSLLQKTAAQAPSVKERALQYILYAPLQNIQPDIVHFEFGTLAHAFRDIKAYFSGKVSVSFRGYDLNYVGLSQKDYYQNIWDTFDGYHFLGNDLKRRAEKRGYRNRGVEALIPPAVDTSLFSGSNRVNKVRSDKFVVLSVSRLTWKKGLEYGVRAISILKQKGIPVQYRIIGDGDFLQAIQFTIAELGLEEDVILMGKKDKKEIQEQLTQADVFLQPSVSEGFCNAVVEAQATGVPAVVTDADGLSENVVDGETGFVVPKWDVAAMADKLQWCYEHPEATETMGQRGVARVAANFRLEEQILNFKDFYIRLYHS